MHLQVRPWTNRNLGRITARNDLNLIRQTQIKRHYFLNRIWFLEQFRFRVKLSRTMRDFL